MRARASTRRWCVTCRGNPVNAHEILISENALDAHKAHGDVLIDETTQGACESEPPPACEGDPVAEAPVTVSNVTTSDPAITELEDTELQPEEECEFVGGSAESEEPIAPREDSVTLSGKVVEINTGDFALKAMKGKKASKLEVKGKKDKDVLKPLVGTDVRAKGELKKGKGKNRALEATSIVKVKGKK